MLRRAILFAFVGAAVLLAGRPGPRAPLGARAPAATSHLTITALANAGVMLSDGTTAVLIDALFRDGIRPYARLEEKERTRLESALPPYDAVRLVLVTHWHADHFDPDALLAHLDRNPRARGVVAPQVKAKAGAGAAAGRIETILPGRGAIATRAVNGLEVSAVRLAHNPSRNFPEEHMGQAVRLAGRLVLHTGDADPVAANFKAAEPLAPIDVAIVPYWYLLSEEGRGLVRDQLRARHVVAVHVESEEATRIRAEVGKAWPGAKVF